MPAVAEIGTESLILVTCWPRSNANSATPAPSDLGRRLKSRRMQFGHDRQPVRELDSNARCEAAGQRSRFGEGPGLDHLFHAASEGRAHAVPANRNPQHDRLAREKREGSHIGHRQVAQVEAREERFQS